MLVFQLADFLLDDAHSFSVYEHCVLLKAHSLLYNYLNNVE